MINLAIIEDNAAYRTALELYIQTDPDIEIVYVDSSVSKLIDDSTLQPNVVIMDIDLGRESGIEGVTKIKDVFPDAGIFMLTAFG